VSSEDSHGRFAREMRTRDGELKARRKQAISVRQHVRARPTGWDRRGESQDRGSGPALGAETIDKPAFGHAAKVDRTRRPPHTHQHAYGQPTLAAGCRLGAKHRAARRQRRACNVRCIPAMTGREPHASHLELVGAAREHFARSLRQPNGARLAVLGIAQDAKLATIVFDEPLQPVWQREAGIHACRCSSHCARRGTGVRIQPRSRARCRWRG